MRRIRAAAVATLGCAALCAARASAEDLLVLDATGALLFVRKHDGVTGARAITGVDDGGRIRAIAKRPKNGVLYGLTSDRLYSIDVSTGAATVVGPKFVREIDIEFRAFGFVFDPRQDVGRVLMPTYPPGAAARPTGEIELRLDPDTGAGTVAPQPFVYALDDAAAAAAAAPNVTSAAYAPDGTLFAVDGARSALVKIDAVGTIETVAPIGGLAGVESPRALAILDDGSAFLLADASPPSTSIHSLDLATGVATPFAFLDSRPTLDLVGAPTSALPDALALAVTRATLRLYFRSRRPADVVELAGTLPVPEFGWTGATVVVDVADVVREFRLDARGRGVSGPDSFRVQPKSPGESAAFTLKLRKVVLPFAPFDHGDPAFTTSVHADVYVDGHVHRALLPFVVRPKSRGTEPKAAGAVARLTKQ